MRLQLFKVQYETNDKRGELDHGYLTIGEFYAYNELHLQMVMKEQLGYYPPIYYIIEPEQAQTQ